ncbi:hypothetical protein ACIBK8_01705 [Streptomyces sp. NPDC050161]|uniref:hypothetical protein n=1 Tax=Streptomyces sp. NPDC050161 TaxID=3365604 RepID=UPI0037A9B75E
MRPGQKMLLLTSTWGQGSLLGRGTDAIRRALAELPRDAYRVVAAIHPNAWHGHGGWQIRSWLEPFRRSGLVLPVPTTDTWKAAVCAADAFIGDHGSLTLYAAGRGLPGLLASFDDSSVAPGSPMARLGELLPRIAPAEPLTAQLDRARRAQQGDLRLAEVGQLITSCPGEALPRFRRLCYRMLALDEPAGTIAARPVDIPLDLPVSRRAPLEQPLFVDARVVERGPGPVDAQDAADGAGGPGAQEVPAPGRAAGVVLRRYPAGPQHGSVRGHLQDPHVVAEEGEPDPRWANVADVVVSHGSGPDALFARHPGCWLIVTAASSAGESCRLRLRGGGGYAACWKVQPWWASPSLAASALHACLARYGDGWEGVVEVRAGEGLPPALLSLRKLAEPAAGDAGPEAAERVVGVER